MGRFHIAASIALAMGCVQRVPAGALTSRYWITLGLRGIMEETPFTHWQNHSVSEQCLPYKLQSLSHEVLPLINATSHPVCFVHVRKRVDISIREK